MPTLPRSIYCSLASGLLIAAWSACSDDAGVMTGAMLPGAAGTLAVAAGAPAAAASGTGASGSTGMTTATAGTPAAGGGAGTTSSSTAGSGAVAGSSGSTAGAGAAGMVAAGGGASGASGAAAGAGGSSGSAGGTAGSGGSGGAAGSAGAAGSGMPAMHEDLGKGDGHDVVLLGDSYMSNTLQFEGTGGGIVPSLLRISGQRYRNYAVQGTMLLMDDSFGPAIPTQWDDAKRINPDVKTVVMTGGGNDIIQNSALQASCMMGGDDCKQLLLRETKRFDELWTAMAGAGVQDIIRIAYATDTGTVDSKLLNDPEVTAPPPICTSGKVRCHNLNTNDLIKKEIAADGIHPLQSANERVAQAVFDLMEKEGMRR
jgi:hypothetical protein